MRRTIAKAEENHSRMKKIGMIVVAFLLVLVCFGGSNAANIALGSATATLGVTPEISISADLSPGSGEEVAALQFDVDFSATNLVLDRVTVGTAAQAVGKGVEFSAVSNSKVRVLVYGSNQNIVSQGRIAQLFFKLASTAVPGVAPLALNQIVMCDKIAAVIASDGTNGAITIEAPETAPNLSNTKVYPNPFKSSAGHDRIVFMDLTEGSTIKIYTLSGKLVKKIKEQTGGMAEWNIRNKRGKKVSSGIYIYLITNKSGEKKKGKIAIVK